MAYICTKCGEIFKPQSLKIDTTNNFQHCPKISCIGEVIELDELILPSIVELNKKGYYTKYCCSGHYYESPVDSYIVFQDGIELSYLPNNYEYDSDSIQCGHITIRNSFINDSSFKAVTSNAMTLYDWTLSLPNRNIK